ncbi:MAG: uracil-DNA glycosylase family protein [Patescibacteria group bacterium]
MDKQERLKKLHAECKGCQKCILRSSCSQVVPGEGNPGAEILFIGEGPGKKEDELGRPFVGAAGKFLDEMLGIINLKREDIFIANVVKCRPPENRDPLPEEVSACWPWLLSQIQIIQPKLVVTLGRHSMGRFFPEKKISEIHGRALRKEMSEIGRQVFFTMYHPAAALYNGSMRETLIKDFRKIPKVLEKIKSSD